MLNILYKKLLCSACSFGPIKKMFFTLNSKSKRHFIIVVLVMTLASYYFLQIYITTFREPYFINWTWSQSISCHYEDEGNALPPAEDLTPPEDSIFFHETSCRGGFTSREACAVESVARLHPERQVFVFFNSPVSKKVLTRSCLAKLKEFENVNLARLHTVKYAQGTVLEEMLEQKENNDSKWRVELTSDMLRYITMYKYGGIYLDTDTVVVKRLDTLGKNWVAVEDGQIVNVAVMAIGKQGVGHTVVEQILNGLKSDFRPDKWQYNGPGGMTRALLKFCGATKVSDLNAGICHGFKVYHASFFYPVHWKHAHTYFIATSEEENSDQAYTHHLWNKVTRKIPVETGSLYDRLAKKYCPSIRRMYGKRFGM